MKSSELLKLLTKDGWYLISQKGSHMKLAHPTKRTNLPSGYLIFAHHGSDEVPKGSESKYLKEAGLK